MNGRIKPVFEIVIPRIQSANIKYWVYGGLGYAALAGSCYRNNPDVDLFVLETDFNNVENILDELCQNNNWKRCKELSNGRTKLEIFILKNNKKWIERLSVISAYKKDNCVELKFRKGSGEYSLDILQQIERQLDNIRFFTISDEFLKKLFIEYLSSKKKYPQKRAEDARHLLSKQEFKKYFPDQSYEKS